MAVTTVKTSGSKFLENCGVDKSSIQALGTANIKVITVNKTVKLVKDGEVLASAKLSMTSMDLINVAKGSLILEVVEAVKKALEAVDSDLVEKIIQSQPKVNPFLKKVPIVNPETGGSWSAGDTPITKVSELKPSAGASGAFDETNVFPLTKMKSTPTKKLHMATRLYEPVQGTGGTSRYFVVAIGTDLKIACRYDKGRISLRMEGDLQKHKAAIEGIGFADVVAKDYVSMHVDVPDVHLAAKTLGSVIIGLGIAMNTPMPQIDIIKNQGSG